MGEVKLALIPPNDLLEYTELTDFQLMLPQMMEDEQYRYVYTQHCADPNMYVILDNGEAEGQPMPQAELLDMALQYKVNELVLPDVIRNSEATERLSNEMISRIRNMNGAARNLRLMYVIQGRDMAEFVISLGWALANEDVYSIGIPRHAIETCDKTWVRFELAELVHDQQRFGNEPKPIHLLGGSPMVPTELRDTNWKKLKLVRSTDTSSPFNYAYAMHTLRAGIEVRRPADYFNMPFSAFDLDLVDRNVAAIRKWTGK